MTKILLMGNGPNFLQEAQFLLRHRSLLGTYLAGFDSQRLQIPQRFRSPRSMRPTCARCQIPGGREEEGSRRVDALGVFVGPEKGLLYDLVGRIAGGEEPTDIAARATSKPRKLYILTTSCPDTTGIVAAIAGFLAANNGLITEAQHYDDPHTRRSFMRTAFHDDGQGMPTLEVLHRKFAEEVGRRFGMDWHFHEVQRRCRALIAVSRQGHCLNSILHRWSTETLPIEVVAVVYNHQDMRSLAEWQEAERLLLRYLATPMP